MTVSDMGQAKVFAINVLLGMLCVLIYDFFRAIRHRYAFKSVTVNLLDGAFFTLSFGCVLLAGMKFNFGAFRYYQAAGLIIGALIHLFLFSEAEVKLLNMAVGLLVKVFFFIMKLFIFPIYKISSFVITLFSHLEDKIIRFFGRKTNLWKQKRGKNKKIFKKRMKMM